jgi:hypothetical protein
MSTKTGNKPKQGTAKGAGKRGAKLSSSVQSYTTAPVSKGMRRTTREPLVRPLAKGKGTRFTHRELISDITSLSAASIFGITNNIPINPGNSDCFPWLSGQATGFELYRFRSLKFEYQSLSATSLPGVLLMAVDYDAADEAPPTKVDMMSYEGATRCNVWDHTVMPCSRSTMDDFVKGRFILGQLPPEGTDIKTYNLGNLFVATDGVAASTKIGELYVDYDVDLLVPQLNRSLGDGNLIIASANTAANLFAGSLLLDPTYSVLSVPTFYGTRDILRFRKKGDYMVTLIAVNSITAVDATQPVLTLVAGAATNLGALTSIGVTTCANTTVWTAVFRVKVTASFADIRFDCSNTMGVGTTTGAGCRAIVREIPLPMVIT